MKVAARNSPLSRAQVIEVEKEIQQFFPSLKLEPIFVETTGDLDLKRSLRDLDKTDFFTKELDELVQRGFCRISIHSAKDLPENIPPELCVVAITKGVDPSDSLVMRVGETLSTLPLGAIIATSSKRREENVNMLRSDFRFIDLRGKIHDRLKHLENKAADGVVIAEAAIIRLKLTHLNRIRIPGETAPLQGKLAILARKEDREMQEVFALLSST
ncbi:MAG TPA: hydroxymethylbilane synthase [Chlamydiales bacterium]|nr:hydroxymethylbilane synthase [Chlamydiales bacterium]